MIDDPRGCEVRLSTHEVKTLTKALEWYPGVTEDQLPIRIEQATVNGRMCADIFNNKRELIFKRG